MTNNYYLPEPQRKNEKVWKFVHQKNFKYKTDVLKGREFDSEWLSISQKGKITVKGKNGDGYAWDGCTPKVNKFDITWGNFDGKLIRFKPRDYKPMTYYASMIHDVLYQYKSEAPVTRKEADIIFKDMLEEVKFKWRRLFYLGVRWFGGSRKFGEWKHKNN